MNKEKYSGNSYKRIKNMTKVGVSGLALIATTGCLTMGGENGIWTIATSPFRPEQWKKHPTRTTFITSLYAGGIYAATQSGGGSSDPAPAEVYTEPDKSDDDDDDDDDDGDDDGGDDEDEDESWTD